VSVLFLSSAEPSGSMLVRCKIKLLLIKSLSSLARRREREEQLCVCVDEIKSHGMGFKTLTAVNIKLSLPGSEPV
jgi:hypothetical protein